MKNLKVVFMGTPTFSVPILKELIANCNVLMVVSQPDREKDRKGNILETPTKIIAKEHNIEVYQPVNIKNEYKHILDANPDIIITCAYGQIIPETVLNYPKYGCINVHGSLLPKLRGGAPIHHAIINGFEYTGITIMYMDKLMDSGDIISQESIKILDEDELINAHNSGDVSDEEFELVYKIKDEILPTIKDKTNELMNIDYMKYLNNL